MEFLIMYILTLLSLLIIWTKDTKILNFRLKLKRTTPSLFSMLIFVEKKINFSSFVALEHKFGLVYTLLHRSFTIVSDFFKFILKLKHLRKYFPKMLIPQNLLLNV